jgi:hypothetical protein
LEATTFPGLRVTHSIFDRGPMLRMPDIGDVRMSDETSIGPNAVSGSDEASDPDGDGGKELDPVEMDELPT